MTTNKQTGEPESTGKRIVREWVASLDYGSLPPGKISGLVNRIDAVDRAAVATPGDDDLVSRADAKAAICYMCADRDRYKPARLIEGSERLFHFQESDNWNAGQCYAQAIDVIPKYVATPPVDAEDADILDDEESIKELRRWQDAIRDKLIAMGAPDDLIDGAGCDSGDPLDFTLAEVGQGVGYFIDQLEALRAATPSLPPDNTPRSNLEPHAYQPDNFIHQFTSASRLPSVVAPTDRQLQIFDAGFSPRTCVKCKHYDETEPRGRCISTYYDAGGSLVYCGCKCEFAPVAAPEGEQER